MHKLAFRIHHWRTMLPDGRTIRTVTPLAWSWLAWLRPCYMSRKETPIYVHVLYIFVLFLGGFSAYHLKLKAANVAGIGNSFETISASTQEGLNETIAISTRIRLIS